MCLFMYETASNSQQVENNSFRHSVSSTARADLATFNSSDGRVVRASASGAVDLGLIPSRVKPTTLKLVFTATASLLDAQH